MVVRSIILDIEVHLYMVVAIARLLRVVVGLLTCLMFLMGVENVPVGFHNSFALPLTRLLKNLVLLHDHGARMLYV